MIAMAKEKQISKGVKSMVEKFGGSYLRFEDMFAVGLPDSNVFFPPWAIHNEYPIDMWIELKASAGTTVKKGFLRIGQRAWLVKHRRVGRFCLVLGKFGRTWAAFLDDEGWSALAGGGTNILKTATYPTDDLEEMMEWLAKTYSHKK
jgi:hypothetical protein